MKLLFDQECLGSNPAFVTWLVALKLTSGIPLVNIIFFSHCRNKWYKCTVVAIFFNHIYKEIKF